MRRILPLIAAILFLAAPAAAQEGRGALSSRGLVVLDIEGGGVDGLRPRSGKEEPVFWDIDADGRTEAVMDWLAPGDALLALDRDANGVISDSYELFSGIEELARLNTDGDDRIDSGDAAAWSRLYIWQDRNSDGQSAPDELQPLAESNIRALSLVTRMPSKAQKKRGLVLLGHYMKSYGTHEGAVAMVVAGARYDDSAGESLRLSPAQQAQVAVLPQVQGFGLLPDLHAAVSADAPGPAGLFALLAPLADAPLAALFTGPGRVDRDVEQIMYRWAGVRGQRPQHYGETIDPRKLLFLQRAEGRRGAPVSAALPFWAAYARERKFEEIFNVVYGTILLQTQARTLFRGTDMRFDPDTGLLSGVEGIDQAAVTVLRDGVRSKIGVEEKKRVWINVVRLIDYAVGIDRLDSADIALLERAIEDAEVSGGFDRVAGDMMVLAPMEIPVSRHGRALLAAADGADTDVSTAFASARAASPAAILVMNDVVSDFLRLCCVTPDLLVLQLEGEGFTVHDITGALDQIGDPMARVGYDAVIQADKVVPAGKDGTDHYSVRAYYKDEIFDWALAVLQRTGRGRNPPQE